MSKRKRGDHGHSTIDLETPLALQQKKIQEKLHHGIKVLHRALKVAKGFERQKLSKRQKKAQGENDGDTAERLDRENEALKTLDLMSSANSHMCRTILKNKILSASPALPESIKVQSIGFNADNAIVNVTARLVNTKQAKDAVTLTISSLLAVIGVKTPFRKSTDANRMSKAIASSKEGSMSPDIGDADHLPESQRGSNGGSTNDMRHDQKLMASVSHEGPIQEYDDRIGASSDNVSLDQEPTIAPKRYNVAFDRDLTPSPSPSESSPPPKKGHNKNIHDERSDNSNFLPSLTMGGYWSGSESEPDDEGPDLAPRKNRRGQRARQAIWEKKYGSGAKHLQKPKAKTDQRDDGWDFKRGAQDSSKNSGKGRHFQSIRTNPSAHTQHAARKDGAHVHPERMQRVTGQQKVEKPLHPSWEAAIKAKEQKQTANFTGKKVTFD